MNLVVDIGNSRLKWCLVDEGPWRPGQSVGLETDFGALLDRIWRELTPPARMLVSNVSGPRLTRQLSDWTSHHWGILPDLFRSEKRFGTMRNGYVDPEQLGCDRWAALIGARTLVDGAVCVVDCGTAITVDALSRDDLFVGGVIFPGMDLIQESLLSGTSDISERRSDYRGVLGRSTAECVAGGSYTGAAGAVDRIVADMASALGDESVKLITGGGARFLLPLLQHQLRHEPDLVLIGLAQKLREAT